MSFLNAITANANPYTIGAALAVGAVAYLALRPSKKIKPERKAGVVYLNILGRTAWSPNASPFCVKLETWLRMAQVPYEVVNSVEFSKKGKSPWIEYNGQAIADSSFAIDFMSDAKQAPELKVSIDDHLSTKEKAVARAFRVMVDEEMYWGIIFARWLANQKLSDYIGEIIPIPGFMQPALAWFLRRSMRDASKAHGIGRHTADEIVQIITNDLQAINDQLGDSKYLMGDKVSSVDAAVFASIQGMVWCPYSQPFTDVVKSKFPKLIAYIERVKATFWPDWDEYLKPNGKKAFP